MRGTNVILALAISLITIASCKKKDAAEKDPLKNKDLEELPVFISKILKENKLTGLAAGIVTAKNPSFWSGTYGYSDLKNQTPVNNKTMFKVGSVSKPITALLLLKLVEENKVNLDADINEYLSFNIQNPYYKQDKITLRQLLTHTSGISDHVYEEKLLTDFLVMDRDHPMHLSDFCKEMLQINGKYYSKSNFNESRPGSNFQYSNLGVALVGCVIEKVSGKSFEDYSEQVLFRPLEMTNTSWHLTNRVAMPYRENRDPYGLFSMVDLPAGGLHSNVEDLSKVLNLIMNNGTFNGKVIFSSAVIAEMKRIQFPNSKNEDLSNQGLLWEYTQPGTYYLGGHNGSVPGSNAVMWYHEKSKVGGIILLNRDFGMDNSLSDVIGLLDKLIKAGSSNKS